MGIVEKEGGWPVFDTDILNTFFLPTVEINAQLMGKVGENLPVTEGLTSLIISGQLPVGGVPGS